MYFYEYIAWNGRLVDVYGKICPKETVMPRFLAALSKAAKVTVAAACLAITSLSGVVLAADKITVFAAASLKNALDEVNAAYKVQSGVDVSASYAASSALAKQIESGAPADVFISADVQWMDYLSGKKLVTDETRKNLLGNTLVLVAGKDAVKPVEIKKGFDLIELLGDGKLAMGAVDSVPAGKYGKQALESLGVWSSVESHVAQAENVRAALVLVAKGEAPYGIVYRTDAAAEKNVSVVGTFPEDSHAPIVYPAAIVASSQNSRAGPYLAFLQSATARTIFETQGFIVLK
jgi:molybdate transport system substrate-binding protein